ncbi:MAG: hypothetical protein K8I30_13140 [Anaerolineae bacterium]|nr:hypothetical protein [Anaerolineae bacterium]
MDDYPSLIPFIQGQWLGEEETQPVEPIRTEEALKARGQVTAEIKAYRNKMKGSLRVPQKARVR